MLRLFLLVLTIASFLLAVRGAPKPSLPIKPVFRDLNATQREQLNAIIFNTTSTRAQIKAGVRNWVAAQKNDTLQALYDKHQEEKGEWKKLFMEVHNERVAKLSDQAKDLDAKLMAIWKDDKMTIPETCERITQLIATAPDFVVKELFREIRKCAAGDPDHFIL